MNPFLLFHHPSQVTSQYRRRIIVATGHRPQKLDQGYVELTRAILIQVATEWLHQLAPRGVISGLALGWDSAVIEACLALKIPYVGCVPFEGQERRWPGKEQHRYKQYKMRAAKVFLTSPGEYTAKKMELRNQHMVRLALKDGPEHALMLALWSGAPGGTKNCLVYAQKKDIEIVNCWNHYRAHVKK
jgi:uncharacterized phage-like protein YoqJ